MASSRPWKLTTNEVIGKTITAADSVTQNLDLPPILPSDQMGELLGAALEERHFEDDGTGKLTRERDGVTVTVDTNTGTLTASAEESQDLPMPPPPPSSPCTCRQREKLKQAHNERVIPPSGKDEDELQRKVTARLEGVVSKLGCEIEAVVHGVTKKALKKKAAQLGEVVHEEEDKQGGLVIVVKVAS